MPIRIPNSLPARRTLESENIFAMDAERADTQDIRPLSILILNLMPTKVATETQLLRLLSNTPLQVNVEFIQTSTYTSKNTPIGHLLQFYKTFDEIKGKRYDGMIITGAPVEHLEFEEVAYWDELCRIMDWSVSNVYSAFHICWGAQAALYHHYGIKKYPLPKKMFGIYKHKVLLPTHPLTRGFDILFPAPHSRHTEIRRDELERDGRLRLLSVSDEAGINIAACVDNRQFFVTGHSEYDPETLAAEYMRDRDKGLDIAVPVNYFENDDPALPPTVTWRAHAHLLYANWLNYFVYQATPYDLKKAF